MDTTYLDHVRVESPATGVCAGNTPFGGEIVKALKQPGSAVSSRAAAVLTCMLEGNAATKQRLLTIPLELSPAPGSPPGPLMLHCILHLSEAILSPGTPPPSTSWEVMT